MTIVAGPIRPDRAAGDRRLAELLELIQDSCAVDIYQEYQEDVGASQRFRPRTGRLCINGWRGLATMLSCRRYAGVLIEFWKVAEQTMEAARARQPWAACVVDSVDVHFVREESAASVGAMRSEMVAKNKERELAVYAAADMVIVVSEEDRRALEAEGVKTPVLLIPIIVPLRDRPRVVRGSEVLFVGWFNHAPNTDGILWFVRECWDAVRRAVPDARLSVVGSNPTREVMELAGVPGVEVHGYVADTAAYFDRAAVSIAPLRYGAGMKGKVCEALASGVPLVTTSVGAQGVPLVSGMSARIADTPREFSDAVVWALQSPDAAGAMANHGRDIVSRICSTQAVLPQVRALADFFKRRQRPSLGASLKWWLSAACFRVLCVSRHCVALSGGRWLRRWLRSRWASSPCNISGPCR